MKRPRKNIKINSALLGCILIAGCGGGGSGTTGQASNTAVVQSRNSVLGKYCSACHAPPSPDLHSKSEWPGVVDRMNMHRVEARMSALTDHERQEVLAYLQSHAAAESDAVQ
jgi:Dihaem cytochrome c